MKTLLIAPVLALAACVSPGPGLVPMEGPVVRTIERVLQRTEVYLASEELPGSGIMESARPEIEAAIIVARKMTLQPDADGAMLAVTMAGLMGLHDYLVYEDLQLGNLEQLEADIYLEDTARLRSLFNAVSIHDAGPYEPNPVPFYVPSN